ncbi:hypothetical protein D1631_01670 [Chryseobacterium nematophagum]|uniref:Uncharacterized protein n=1 Tax=Chryseobacterium nematophagum TaxID=2305228 RepID=A0A3M7TEV4_9FLAO|nr:hypothetical protein [Chryseobacterium nematophagum]RNA60730.1 hypothetical protein D1631_01670 [Chryseobacterium nematophagum]
MYYIKLIIGLIVVSILLYTGEAILEILRDELRKYKTANNLYEELGEFLNKILGKGIALVIILSLILSVPALIFLIVFLIKAFIFD